MGAMSRGIPSQSQVEAEPVRIVAYNPQWSERFTGLRVHLKGLLGELAVSIEHIGSTAVPGLPAKAIIDMAAVVRDYTESAAAFDALASFGWLTAPEPGDREARKWSLCFPTIERRSHHLHIFEQSSTSLRTLLAFRDHLRSDPADRAEYARIKRELAAADDEDRPAYRTGKAPFITEVLAKLEL